MDQNLFFATNSNPDLVAKICELTGLHLAKYRLGRFADGEVSLHLDEPVALKVAFVLGSFCPPAENLIELLTLINTLHINGVAKIVAIIPYLGYGKSDRLDRPNIPVNARLFIETLEVAGADQFITVNLHSQLMNRYFRVPHLELSAMGLFAETFKQASLTDLTVVAPDQGGIDRASEYARAIGQNDIVVIEKHRPTDDQTEVVKVNGDVKGKNVILVDDIIQTGLTLITAAKALKDLGAHDIYLAATHFVYSAGALDRFLTDNNIKQIYTTNSIPFPSEITLPDKLKIVPIEPLLAEVIKPLLTS
jgi:ribose-phosphate pyrophosphokinase